MAKLTKQGVRDLNGIKPGPPKGRVLEEPPHVVMKEHCYHTRIEDYGTLSRCQQCGEIFD